MSGDCSGASCSGTYFYSFVSRFAGVGKGSRTLFTVLDLHLVFYRSFALKLFVFVVFGCARPGVDELFRLFWLYLQVSLKLPMGLMKFLTAY